MIGRYTLPEMAKLWSEEEKYSNWLLIEQALINTRVHLGKLPERINDKAKKLRIYPSKIAEREKSCKHDVQAFLETLYEQMGTDSAFLHEGLTSSDIVDTNISITMIKSIDLLLWKVHLIAKALDKLAKEHENTLTIGRTHGQWAEEMSLSHKFRVWWCEFSRHYGRLLTAKKEMREAKLSGPLGDSKHITEEESVLTLATFGLHNRNYQNQIVQRDNLAQTLGLFATISGTINKICEDIRNLQRPEIGEIREYHHNTQKGSSCMPHKRNPINCEQLCGLSRVMKAYAQVAFDDQSSWGERDLTNSSAERIILPDSCILLYFMLDKFLSIVSCMEIDKDRIKLNLEKASPYLKSHEKYLDLAKKSGRLPAYKEVKESL